jgi:hypothetical protein
VGLQDTAVHLTLSYKSAVSLVVFSDVLSTSSGSHMTSELLT